VGYYLTEKRFEKIAIQRVVSQKFHGDVGAAHDRAHHPPELASDKRECQQP
jgi:hypothetical protein